MKLIVVLFFLSGLIGPAAATDSDVEKQLSALVQVLKSPTDSELDAFLKANLDPALLSAYPMKEHVAYFKSLSDELGTFELVAVATTSGFDFNVDVKTAGDDAIKRYLVEFNPNPPHGLMGMQRTPYTSFAGLQVKDYDLLHTTLQQKADVNEFSGNLLIEHKGQVVFNHAYGMAEKRFGIKNQLDTRFNLASITKDFTALAILQLSQAGKLELDDRIGQYIPEFPKAMGEHITIRHLLTHQSGLGQSFDDPEFEKIKHRINDIEDYVNIIKDDALQFQPGTSDAYSNNGFEVLAIIVQRVSGQRYYDYVQSHIFDRLGMHDTGFVQVSLAQEKLARNYTNLSPLGPDSGFVRETVYLFPAIGSASGGAYSTTGDMLIYLRAIEQGTLLDAKHQRQFINNYPKDNDNSPLVGKAGAGGAPGVSTFYAVHFAHQVKIIILSNYDERLAEDMAVHLYQQLKNGG